MATHLLPDPNFKRSHDYLDGFNDALDHVQMAADMSDEERTAKGIPAPTGDQTTGCITCGAYLVKTAIALWSMIH